jgi:hypothetical protein
MNDLNKYPGLVPDFAPREIPEGESSTVERQGTLNDCHCGYKAIAETLEIANTAACEFAHALREERDDALARVESLEKALTRLLDVYIETRDGKPYAIRVIKIGMGAFNKAYDAFEFARKTLAKSNTGAADRIRAEEREACAKIAEDRWAGWRRNGSLLGGTYATESKAIAAAIRARGES